MKITTASGLTLGLVGLEIFGVSAFSSKASVLPGAIRTTLDPPLSFTRPLATTRTNNKSRNAFSTASPNSTTKLNMVVGDNDKDFTIPKIKSPLFATVWVGFLIFALYATNTTDQETTNAILAKFLQDPIHPQVNELFACVFNLLGLVAIPMACLALPGSNKDDQSLPAVPLVLGSAFAGISSLGLYMMTRTPQPNVVKTDLGWFTANVLENKIFNWIIVGMILNVFWVTNLVPALLSGTETFGSELDGYWEMAQSAAIVSASSLDLLILTLTAAWLIPEDLQRRGVQDTSKANLIAASTVLLPVVGSAIYCALRPALPEE